MIRDTEYRSHLDSNSLKISIFIRGNKYEPTDISIVENVLYRFAQQRASNAKTAILGFTLEKTTLPLNSEEFTTAFRGFILATPPIDFIDQPNSINLLAAPGSDVFSRVVEELKKRDITTIRKLSRTSVRKLAPSLEEFHPNAEGFQLLQRYAAAVVSLEPFQLQQGF